MAFYIQQLTSWAADYYSSIRSTPYNMECNGDVEQLPEEIVAVFFKYVPAKELPQLSLVCKRWKHLIDKHYLGKIKSLVNAMHQRLSIYYAFKISEYGVEVKEGPAIQLSYFGWITPLGYCSFFAHDFRKNDYVPGSSVKMLADVFPNYSCSNDPIMDSNAKQHSTFSITAYLSEALPESCHNLLFDKNIFYDRMSKNVTYLKKVELTKLEYNPKLPAKYEADLQYVLERAVTIVNSHLERHALEMQKILQPRGEPSLGWWYGYV